MRRVCLALIAAYQMALRPMLGLRCRFHPSCSDYAREAFSRLSLPRALLLTLRRLLRCQPFAAGGLDPVPETP